VEGSGHNAADAKLVTRADEGMDDGSSMTLWEGHWSEGEQEDMHYTDTLELNLSLSTSNLNLALLGHPGHTNHVQYIYSSKETASLCQLLHNSYIPYIPDSLGDNLDH